MKSSLNTLLLGLLMIGFSSLNGYTQTVFDAAKCYRIVNKVSGKSLEIKDSSSAEGAVIFQWATVTGKTNQLWQVKKLADGRYSFVSKSSGKLIDTPDCTEGGVIKQYASDGTDSQKWRFDVQTDGSYKLYNTSCNKYLRLESGSAADGASVGIKNDFGTDAFKWLIQEAACSSTNTATASIKNVFVYADNNNDTHYNQGDGTISGVTVTLTNANNQIVATATSATNGSYSFLNLAAGTYTLTFPATLADGKAITTRNPISVTLTAGQVFTSASAGYFKPIVVLGSISGLVYNDKNYNGKYDAGDVPLSGVKLGLSMGIPYTQTVTDINGVYTFKNLPSGMFRITSLFSDGNFILPNYYTTFGDIIVELAAGQNYKNADYAYIKPSIINGSVFGDENKNGLFDSGELPISNLQLNLTNLPPQPHTDSSGNFSIVLPKGTYSVEFPIFSEDGKRLTSAERVSVNLAQGQTVTGINGVYSALPSIYGSVYKSSNTFIDLPVTLYDSNNVVVATTKSSNMSLTGYYEGMYSFIDLKPGTYTVKFPDTLADGYILSTPNPTKIKLVKGQHFKLDAPYFPAIGGVINSIVWYDRNNNGTFDGCYKGMTVCDGGAEGVPVTLYNAAGKFLKTAVTTLSPYSGRGETIELFTGLKLGTYKIKFPDTLPNGSRLIPATTTTTVTLDYRGVGHIEAGYSYNNPIPNISQNTLLNMMVHAEPSRAQIQWVNNTGSQNDFFTVEKQNPTTGDFDKLETVNSKSSQTNEVYIAYDNAVTEGDNTYRIALTLLDGTVKTSALKTVNFKGLNDIRIFPNPADEFINVDLRKYEGKTVALSVYNSVGLLVKKQTIEKVSAAPQQFDIQGFGAGSYLMRVQSEGKREVTRLFHIAK